MRDLPSRLGSPRLLFEVAPAGDAGHDRHACHRAAPATRNAGNRAMMPWWLTPENGIRALHCGRLACGAHAPSRGARSSGPRNASETPTRGQSAARVCRMTS